MFAFSKEVKRARAANRGFEASGVAGSWLIRATASWLAAVQLEAAQDGSWRLYTVAEGLGEPPCVAVTVSPRGNVWAQHPGGKVLSGFDGYSIRTITPGAEVMFPVHESRSGQLWVLSADGLVEYRTDFWFHHELAEVRAERESQPLKVLRNLPILPAERNRVLILLPRELIRYDALEGRSVVLRRAEQTGLERFVDIAPARDGDVWVAGLRGVARLPGPERRLTAETPWTPILLPLEWKLQLTGGVFEDDEGGLVGVGEGPDERRVVLHLSANTWGPSVPAPEGVRNAWMGAGGRLWAHSRSSLQVWREDHWETIQVPGLATELFNDVAVEPNDVFWLATSRGLVRHAPRLWQAWSGASAVTGPFWCVLEAPKGRLCFTTSGGVLVLEGGTGRLAALPEGSTLGPADRPVAAGGDLYVLDRRGLLLRLDEREFRFAEVPEAAGRRMHRLLGQLRDGRLALVTVAEGTEVPDQLEAFDGQRFESLAPLPAGGEVSRAWYFVHDGGGNLRWLGGSQGLWVWEERSKEFRPVEGYPRTPACWFIEESPEKVWCGGSGALMAFDGRRWIPVRLPAGEIRSLARGRDGGLWIASGNKVFRYATSSWMDHADAEGLPGGAVWDCRADSRGNVWAATDVGVYHFSREVDLEPPKTLGLAVAGGGREFSVREHPTLVFRGRDKWDQVPPARLRFAARLDEGQWSAYLPVTSVTLSNLSPGDHRFAVRAIDSAFNEEPEPMILEFSAFVPWYEEPRLLAVLAAAVFVACLLAWLAVNRHLQLRRSHAEVERIVAQRTRELERANQELLHSQKMRALGTLAAGIAHDFNSILSIIKGSAQIIEDHLHDEPKIRTRLSRIKTMVEQGSGIVRAMLGLSHGAQQGWQSIDVIEFLRETARLVSDPLAPGITVELEPVPSALPSGLRFPPDLVRQVLLNLMFNAADAMAGKGCIRLRPGRQTTLPPGLVLAPAPAAEYVTIEVVDTGHGIDPEVLPRIFEPFFTTKAFSTRKGTGLGLTMVYEIAKEGGLGLSVDSAPGQGSTFTIFLPVIATADAPA